MVKTAAAYIRVSTDEQAEQSPESQLIEIRKYADAHGLVLPDNLIYVDEGISGKRSENRPAFQNMIGAAKEKPPLFDVLLLWKFSRFARNQEESIVYKALLRKQCGIEVLSVSEQLPEGPFASLIERIIEWFDEFYSIRLSQEVKRTMTVKAGRGELQSTPSFGYRTKMEPGKKTILEPVPEEAEIVREIFDRFVSGEGYYRIARWLNSQGIKTHRGNAWENRTIEYLIRNPVYIGKLRWTPTGRCRRDFKNPDTITADAEHEALIDIDTFTAAQERVAKIKQAWGYKARPTYELKDWLSGLVRCSECGTTLIFQKPHYFICNNYAKGRCRSSQHIHVDALHEAIIDRLREDLQGRYDLQCNVVQKDRDGELNRLRLSLSDLKRREGRLLDAYLGGVLDIGQFSRAKESLSRSIEETEQAIGELTEQLSSEDKGQALRDRIRAALDIIDAPDASLDRKNEALRQLTEKIVFNKAQMVLDITYRLFM